MRNYSGQVGGTLCPEYFHSDYGNRSRPIVGKVTSGKIVIPSRGHLESKLEQRKAVKECYCYSETSKTKLGAKKTRNHSSFPCDYCKSNFDVQISVPIAKTAIPQEPEFLPLNSETFRRVERITYSPTSQFLRRVQKKCCNLKKPNGSYSELSMSSSLRPSVPLTRDSGRGESSVDVRCRGGKDVYGSTARGAEVRSRSDTRADYETQPRFRERRPIIVDGDAGERIGRVSVPSRRSNSAGFNAIRVDDMKKGNVTRKSRSSLRKTIRSAECLNANQPRKERSCMKNSPKRIVRTISTHSRCCVQDDFQNIKSRRKIHRTKDDCEVRGCPEGHCCGTAWQLSRHIKDRTAPTIGDNEDKVRELNEFRNDNYFETHGSTQTLVTSSRSSGSIQQYVLNDRLFPEPVGKIHRDDFVVTMPPSATKQNKRIHYFPKHIVKQDKSISNTNYNTKKRRSQSCGLTGHAVDLGILKKSCPVANSLALRYQKGVINADRIQ